MDFKITIDGKEYAVNLRESKETLTVNVNGKEFDFAPTDVLGVETVRVQPVIMPRRDFSQKEIKAPIAGVISEIFIKEGETAVAGQKLLTLSAMKMENEITAADNVRIKEIKVNPGQKVKEGDILIIFA